jgi:tRNA (mo5U34)-methyltransferase
LFEYGYPPLQEKAKEICVFRKNVPADGLLASINSRQWFHRIELGRGVTTPGMDDSPAKLKALAFPKDLSGKSVIDIGAWDGFFSFEAERRGAAEVLSTDHYCWTRDGIFDKGGFNIAKAALNSNVKERTLRVEELPGANLGTFDLVLFLGVLYHAPDPLGYMKIVRSLTKGMAIIETHVDLLDIDRPAMAYYPGASLNGDATNFFGPNELAVHGLCEDAGFSRVETIAPDRRFPTRMAFHAYA